MFWLLPILAGAAVAGIAGNQARKEATKADEFHRQQQLDDEERRRQQAIDDAAAQRELNRQDEATRFQRLRDSAVSAGFNPLTAIAYAGTINSLGDGFGQYAQYDAVYTDKNAHSGWASFGSVAGGALANAGLSMLENNFAAQGRRENYQYERSLQREQAEMYKANNPPNWGDNYVFEKPEMDVVNYWTRVYDEKTKRWYDIPNPDLQDVGISEMLTSSVVHGASDALTNGPIAAKSWWQSYKQSWATTPTLPTASDGWRDMWSKMKSPFSGQSTFQVDGSFVP